MRMKFGEVFEIEDLGNHPAETVICLGILLAGTVNVTSDPKRKDFYEIYGGLIVYYVYVSPLSGKISFLASWRNVARDSYNSLKSLPPLADERQSSSEVACGG